MTINPRGGSATIIWKLDETNGKCVECVWSGWDPLDTRTVFIITMNQADKCWTNSEIDRHLEFLRTVGATTRINIGYPGRG